MQGCLTPGAALDRWQTILPPRAFKQACSSACRSLLDDPEVRNKCLWQNMRIVQPYVSVVLRVLASG